MANVRTSIVNAIRTILVADPNLEAVPVRAFIAGVAPKVPNHLFPNCEIVITDTETERRLTGNQAFVRYDGEVRFYAKLQDVFDEANPTAVDMASYEQVQDMAYYAEALLEDANNVRLGDLTDESWTVVMFHTRGSQYNIAVQLDRPNNYDNFVSVRWSCRVLQAYPFPVGPAFEFADVNGLAIHLQSDLGAFADTGFTTPASNGSNGYGWQDQSGNNRHVTRIAGGVTYVTDVINGKPVFRFATGGYMQAGDVLDLGANSVGLFFVGKSNNSSGSLAHKAGTANTAGKYGLVYNSGNLTAVYRTASGDENVAISRSHGGFEIVAQLVDRVTGVNTLRANGAELGTNTFAPSATSHDNAFNWRLGVYDPTNALQFAGDIAAVVQYIRATPLTTGEIDLIEAKLAELYAITI